MELYQMGARWYDPQLGRWLSPDTIIPDPINPQNFNRYAFVLNNPTRFTDPTGHCVEPLSGIVCVSAGALIVDVVTVAVAAYLIADTAQDIHQNLESIPAQGPEIPPLPGYGEGELERPPDPGVYNPGPTLGEVQVPFVFPGPPMTVEQPNTVLDFPITPGIEIPNILEARGPQSTYTMVDPATGQVKYVGRTNDLGRRQNEHARDPGKIDLDFVPDRTNLTYEQARGREQLLYENNIDNDLLNVIKPISDRNPKREIYRQAGSNIF